MRNNDYHLKDQQNVARFWTSTPNIVTTVTEDEDEITTTKFRRLYLDRTRVDTIGSNESVY